MCVWHLCVQYSDRTCSPFLQICLDPWLCRILEKAAVLICSVIYYYYYYYYYYSALGLVWAGTRAQSGNRYGSGTLHPGQVS